jgi:hypothetical protein
MNDKNYTKLIKKEVVEPLDDKEIKRFVPNARIITYNELKNYSSLNSLIPEGGTIFLLYQNSPNSGHWCVLKRKNNTVYFFDSYGGEPDTQLNYISKEENQALGIVAPYLTQLFDKSDIPIFYNTYPYQNEKTEISTCGRHGIFFVLNNDEYNRDLKEYNKIMRYLKKTLKCSYDDIVTGFINEEIEKQL